MNHYDQLRRARAIIATLRLDLGLWVLVKLVLREVFR